MTPYEVVGTVGELIDDEMKMRERCYQLCDTKLGSCLQRGVDPRDCKIFNNGGGTL